MLLQYKDSCDLRNLQNPYDSIFISARVNIDLNFNLGELYDNTLALLGPLLSSKLACTQNQRNISCSVWFTCWRNTQNELGVLQKPLSLSFCLSNDSHMGWSSEESAVGPSATFSVFSAAPVCFALRTRNFKELSRAPELSNSAQFHLISKKVYKRKVFFLSLSCCDPTHSTAKFLNLI